MGIDITNLALSMDDSDFDKNEYYLKQLLHDIKSPLSALTMGVHFIEKAKPQQNTSEAVALLKSAVERLCLMTTLEDGLRSFDANRIIEKVIFEKQKLFPQVQFICESEVGLHSVQASGQESEFSRVLSNILNNAVEAGASMVVCRQRLFQKSFQIVVEDNGCGIEEKLLPFVGQRGFSFASRKDGLGLGLSHARATLKSWGGAFHIHSEISKGTLIYLTLRTT